MVTRNRLFTLYADAQFYQLRGNKCVSAVKEKTNGYAKTQTMHLDNLCRPTELEYVLVFC